MPVVTHRTTNLPDVKAQFVSVLESLSDPLLSQVKSLVSSELSKVLITEDLLTNYPFFEDKTKLVNDYLSCLSWHIDTRLGIGIMGFSGSKAKELNLPENLNDLMEFGSRTFPQCSHFRQMLNLLQKTVNKIIKES